MRHCTELARAIYWSSWVDVLPTLHKRHPRVAAMVVGYLGTQANQRGAGHPSLDALEQASATLTDAQISIHTWVQALHGATPPRHA
eukprot:2403552-Karenia_brevis.AAC.1